MSVLEESQARVQQHVRAGEVRFELRKAEYEAQSRTVRVVPGQRCVR